MVFRLSILMLAATLLPRLGVAQDDPTLRSVVGDSIVLELTGKPAATYLRLVNQPVPDVADDRFAVPLEMRIIMINPDNLVADYQAMTKRDSELAQLVTITVSFHRRDLVAPSNYRTPHRKADTEKEQLVQATIARMESLPKVRRNTFEGIKIRVWSLEKEIVE